MPRPRKSTRDEWIDQFDGWPIPEQEVALEIVQFVHRKARRSQPIAEPSSYYMEEPDPAECSRPAQLAVAQAKIAELESARGMRATSPEDIAPALQASIMSARSKRANAPLTDNADIPF